MALRRNKFEINDLVTVLTDTEHKTYKIKLTMRDDTEDTFHYHLEGRHGWIPEKDLIRIHGKKDTGITSERSGSCS